MLQIRRSLPISAILSTASLARRSRIVLDGFGGPGQHCSFDTARNSARITLVSGTATTANHRNSSKQRR